MDDERALVEIDARIRAALRPADETCRRVVAGAFADGASRPRARRWLWPALVSTLVLAYVLGALQRERGTREVRPGSLTVTSVGSTVVVQRDDGRRWIVGPHAPRRGGSLVIVVMRE